MNLRHEYRQTDRNFNFIVAAQLKKVIIMLKMVKFNILTPNKFVKKTCQE